MDMTLDLTEAVVAVLTLVITVGVAYIAPAAKGALNVTIERKHELALQAALTQGAKFAVERMREKGMLDVEIENEAVREAAQYTLDHVPDAVEHFGKTLPALKNMAVSRVADAKATSKV